MSNCERYPLTARHWLRQTLSDATDEPAVCRFRVGGALNPRARRVLLARSDIPRCATRAVKDPSVRRSPCTRRRSRRCCVVGWLEVRAALAAAGRADRLDASGQRRAETAWEDYWEATRPVEPTEPVAARASSPAAPARPVGGSARRRVSLNGLQPSHSLRIARKWLQSEHG